MNYKKLSATLLALMVTVSMPLAACKNGDKGGGTTLGTEQNTPDDNTSTGNPTEDPPVENPPETPADDPVQNLANAAKYGALDINSVIESTASAGAVDFTEVKANTDRSEATAFSGGAISESGKYTVTGNAEAITIGKGLTVHLFLDNATVESADGIAISSDKNCEVTITVTGENSVATTAKKTNALHIKGNLTINGSGTLSVKGTKSAIKVSKDAKIADATLTLEAKNHGIDAQSLAVKDAKITVTSAGKDGIHTECDYDEPKDVSACVFTTEIGYVSLVNVEYTANTKGDGIQADTFIYIDGGKYNITTTGEFVADTTENRTEYELTADDFRYIKSSDTYKKVASDYFGRDTMYALAQGCKGIKVGEIEIDTDGDGTDDVVVYDNANYFIMIKGGEFVINSTDDAIHSNSGDILIDDGTYKVNTYDDAFTADNLLRINGGSIEIESSYEGLEGGYVEIMGGTINLVSSDDGINAASDDNSVREHIIIAGGNITVKAGGDGLDSNGKVYVLGGETTVFGSTTGMDGALDADSGIFVNGGTLFASSVLGMVETPKNTSLQYVLSYANNDKISAGTTIKLADASGKTIISKTVLNECQSIIISAASIEKDGVYKLYAGDSELCSFTVTDIITSVGNSGGGFPGGGGGFPGGGGGFPGGGFPGGPGGGFPGGGFPG